MIPLGWDISSCQAVNIQTAEKKLRKRAKLFAKKPLWQLAQAVEFSAASSCASIIRVSRSTAAQWVLRFNFSAKVINNEILSFISYRHFLQMIGGLRYPGEAHHHVVVYAIWSCVRSSGRLSFLDGRSPEAPSIGSCGTQRVVVRRSFLMGLVFPPPASGTFALGSDLLSGLGCPSETTGKLPSPDD